MTEPVVKVRDIVNSAAFQASGEKVRRIIDAILQDDDNTCIHLDFSGIDDFLTPFFNRCVGDLIVEKSLDYTSNHIVVIKDKISASGWASYQHSIENAMEVKKRNSLTTDG